MTDAALPCSWTLVPHSSKGASLVSILALQYSTADAIYYMENRAHFHFDPPTQTPLNIYAHTHVHAYTCIQYIAS